MHKEKPKGLAGDIDTFKDMITKIASVNDGFL